MKLKRQLAKVKMQKTQCFKHIQKNNTFRRSKKFMMKKVFALATLLTILLLPHSVTAQNIDKKSLTGSWLGKIAAGALELRIVFNLSVIEKDSLIATLDSPDQGAKNIKLGPVTFTGEYHKNFCRSHACRV